MKHTNPKIVCDFHCLRHESNMEILHMIQNPPVDTVGEYDRFI